MCSVWKTMQPESACLSMNISMHLSPFGLAFRKFQYHYRTTNNVWILILAGWINNSVWHKQNWTESTINFIELYQDLGWKATTCKDRQIPCLCSVALQTALDLISESWPSCFIGYLRNRSQPITYFSTESPNNSNRSRENVSQHLKVVIASKI